MSYILNGKKRGLAYCNGKRCWVTRAIVMATRTTIETEENESGGITYKIESSDYTFENGVLTIGGRNAS